MRHFIWALALVLLCAPVGHAADGDPLNTGDFATRPAIKVCDVKAAADQGTDCTEWRIQNNDLDEIFFIPTAVAGCSAWSVEINFLGISGGFESPVVTLSNSGTTSYQWYGNAPEYISVTLTTLTDCTDFTLAAFPINNK